ncbi:MAG: hypothetical protein ACRDB6_08805 [Cetobacterium sp.]
MKKNDCGCDEQREPIIVNPHVEAEANEVIFDLDIKTKIDDGIFEDTIIYTVDSDHPLGILPEKAHTIMLNGPVELKIEFYK